MNRDQEKARAERGLDIALFRYALIRDAADPKLTAKQRGRFVRDLVAVEHRSPDGGAVTVSRNTIDRWLRRYREGGFDALLPAARNVAPRTAASQLEFALALKREKPERTSAQVAAIIKEHSGDGPAERTLQARIAWSQCCWDNQMVDDGEQRIRLQKVLAAAGLGSRRKCEELITAGRVVLDGQQVTELGTRVDPATAQIEVDGLRIEPDTSKVVLALNKPLGVVTAMSDPQGRPTVADYVRDRTENLFHVGRLDADSEGLILLTNDGELANRLSHPKFNVPKTYLVTVAGAMYPRLIKQLLNGVELDDRPARADRVNVVQTIPAAGPNTPAQSLVEITIHDGRNRVVRRMFDAIDRPVLRLVRTKFGKLNLGEQKPGRVRVLSSAEVGSLQKQVGL